MKKLNSLKKAAAFIISFSITSAAAGVGGSFTANVPLSSYAAENTEQAAETKGQSVILEAENGENADLNEAEEFVFDEEVFVSNPDVRNTLNVMLRYYGNKYYLDKTGSTPVDIIIELPYDSLEATITLKDENGKVLEVYSVYALDLTGKDQNGNEVDLINDDENYYREDEDELFAPMCNITEIAGIYFSAVAGPESAVELPYSFFDSTVNWIINKNDASDIYLIDKAGITRAKYSIDPKTGIGTDQDGNEIDLSPYVDTFGNALCYLSRMDYQTYNGEQKLFTQYQYSEEKDVLSIYVFNKHFELLDVYKADRETSIAENINGRKMVLADYLWTYPSSFKVIQNKECREFNCSYYTNRAKLTYIKNNGKSPADITAELPKERSILTITISNDNGDVAEVYTVNLMTGNCTDCNGNDVELEEGDITPLYDNSLFTPLNSVYNAADLCYAHIPDCQNYYDLVMYNGSFITDNGINNTVIILFFDEDYNTLEKYTFDGKTGIGKDSSGDYIDLSLYVDETEELFCTLARKDYQAKTGNAEVYSYFKYSEDHSHAEIRLIDAEWEDVETYTADLATSMAETSGGEIVDLKKHLVIIPEDEYFMPLEYMSDAARLYYKQQTDSEAIGVRIMVNDEEGTVKLVLKDSDEKILDIYILDARTGIGTDIIDKTTDLSGYTDHRTLDESDYFISANMIDDAAREHYIEMTGNTPAGTRIRIDNYEQTAEVTFYDEEDNVIEVYTFNLTTGTGTTSGEKDIDLAEFVATHEITDSDAIEEIDQSVFFAPFNELCDMSVEDYKQKSGKALNCSGYEYDSIDKKLVIYLEDENNNTAEIYSLDPYTGKGTNLSGEAVDLPQTGMSGTYKVFAVLAALMCGTGTTLVKKSRKEDIE